MTQFATAPDGVRLAYEIVGEGACTVLLIHGFASSRFQNWRDTGWYKTLTEAGLRVVAMDCRGHGMSVKPHHVEGYRHDEMARDANAVMDDAGLPSAHVMGYSMGGFIALRLAFHYPERVENLIVAGVGESYFHPELRNRTLIADGLEADDPATITDPTARGFRAFADQPGKDRLALAACMRAQTPHLTRAELAAIAAPALVVCGEKDELTGAPAPLAAALPHGRSIIVPQRDHMTAVGDKVYKESVLAFLLG